MTTLTVPKQILGLLTGFAITFIAAAIGALGSVNAPAFYQTLDLPSWAPPASLFGPVWTVLYALMALAAWLVWRQRGSFAAASTALSLYLVQLVFNAIWSWAFFEWQSGLLALVIIAALWLLIIATIGYFWQINKLAALLLVPYLVWVSFASILNLVVWQMNPMLL